MHYKLCNEKADTTNFCSLFDEISAMENEIWNEIPTNEQGNI